ncbi:MAG: DNA replication/repair protein RecF [Hyphomicrobiales bacterium]
MVDDKSTKNLTKISKLNLTDFRNHSYSSITTDKDFILLTGSNGSGKTNVLEAISMFSASKGLRGSNLVDQSNTKGSGGWSIFMEVHSELGNLKLGTGINKPDLINGKARQCRVDGTSYKSPKIFTNYLGIIWLTPQMDGLFTGQKSDRRKFFDKLINLIEIEHSENVKTYERLIMQRNKVLARLDILEDKWLDNLEKQIAQLATQIFISRDLAVSKINKIMEEEVRSNIFPSAKIVMREEIGNINLHSDMEEIEENLKNLLYEFRKKDKITFRANVGPHRTDFTLLYKKNDMFAENCSTGEQKNLLISLILAEARVFQNNNNNLPILLLDEITAHMDNKRLANLFDQISDIGSQAWLTGTSPEFFSHISDKTDIFEISDGKLI